MHDANVGSSGGSGACCHQYRLLDASSHRRPSVSLNGTTPRYLPSCDMVEMNKVYTTPQAEARHLNIGQRPSSWWSRWLEVSRQSTLDLHFSSHESGWQAGIGTIIARSGIRGGLGRSCFPCGRLCTLWVFVPYSAKVRSGEHAEKAHLPCTSRPHQWRRKIQDMRSTMKTQVDVYN